MHDTDSPSPLANVKYRSTEEILAHPRFVPARIAFVDAVLALYEGDPFLTRLLLEAGRYVTFGNIMCMHARYDEPDQSTWQPRARLNDQMLKFTASTSRTAKPLLPRPLLTAFLRFRA